MRRAKSKVGKKERAQLRTRKLRQRQCISSDEDEDDCDVRAEEEENVASPGSGVVVCVVLILVQCDCLDTCCFGCLIIRGFPTRMVYLHYISCLRYIILVGNPAYGSVL